jgi:hypothetical protein
MQIVTPEVKTTLLLNKYFEAFGVCTARAALRHLMTGRVIGIDANGGYYSWDGTDYDNRDNKEKSVINWKAGNIEVYPDQPVLRSAPVDGKEVFWYIPTIVRCNKTFGYRAQGGKDISLKKCYQIYKGVCQYCYDKIPFSEATKDHCYPKSKGGSNHDFNIVLACKKCNNAKADMYPYFDKFGKPVKPKRILASGIFIPDNPREEWRGPLFLDPPGEVTLA